MASEAHGASQVSASSPAQPATAPDPAVIRYLARGEQWFACAMLLALLCLTVFQIVSRYAFASPFVWTEELARFAMIWLAFVAAGFVMAEGGHIAVSVVGDWLGGRWRRYFYIWSNLAVLATCLVMLSAAQNLLGPAGNVRAPASGLVMSLAYGATIVGFALIAVHAVVNAAQVLRHGDAAIKSDIPAEGR